MLFAVSNQDAIIDLFNFRLYFEFNWQCEDLNSYVCYETGIRAKLGVLMERYDGYAMKYPLILAFFACLNLQFAEFANADNWKVGRLFRSSLTTNVRFQSTGTIVDDLESLSRNTRVAIYLDREIDPSQKVDFPTAPQPLGKTFDDLAMKMNAESVIVGSFIYIAPREKAFRWLVLKNVLYYNYSRLDPSIVEKLKETSELNWAPLATPRDIISVMASNCGLKISNPEMIPHDLWNSRNLPRLANGEQLVFLLSCMDRAMVIDSKTKTIQITKVEPEKVLTLRFRKTDSRKIQSILTSSKLSQIKTVGRGEDFFVRGPLSESLVLTDKMRPKKKWKTTIKPGSKNVFDLNTDASRGGILATIANNRNVKLVVAPDLGTLLKQKIKVQVKQATVEELLDVTLKGTGLRYQLTDTQLIILK